MHVHRSNRTEVLVDVLAGVVAQPAGDATEPECIVVQGKGMERWLSMQLAQRFGVWANPDFPFPRKLVERAIGAVLGPEGAPSACFEPETMMWAVADLLPPHLARPEFASIRSYLDNDERGTKRIALAQRIADTFDQYVVYRPQTVLEWEGGADTDWQAVLWRALVERHGSTHIAARAAAFLAALAGGSAPLTDFPARVSLFGISTVPPLYLRLFDALSARVELHLFILSPSREYWGDIRSQREVIRALSRHPASMETLHFTEGNPLLASLGRLGRDFQQILEATGDYQEREDDLYRDPGTGTMLATLQSDVLRLVHRGSDTHPVMPLRADDASISVHACHSAMREVEVLHDQLLALFDADSTLEPRHVVVLSPAIDAYAPCIEAVFGGTDRPHIPYRIADRGVRATEEVIDAFATLLAVLRGRMTATDLLDLLGLEVIRARFGITVEDLDLLRTWITESGIRWGVDAAHRAAVEQPAMVENTWRFGLDRLLLGYAMAGDGRLLFREVLPYDDIEGTTAELLGQLVDFCEAVFTLRADVEQARPLDAWHDALASALERLIASTSQTADQHLRIRSTLAELAARAEQAGFQGAVDLDAVRTQLDRALQRDALPHGFLAGGVTFCALVPMRTIPFRIVCLLGMHDDAFPRSQRPLGFDLIAQRPRPGDRSPREDDRYLFLEALLSARERLLITYVGQSIRDNTDIPPSVLVSELLDTLGESFCVAGEKGPSIRLPEKAATQGERLSDPSQMALPFVPSRPRLLGGRIEGRFLESPESQVTREQPSESAQQAIREHVVVRHPLQPFSPRYFDESEPHLFSYAAGYCDGAQTLQHARQAAPPFLTAPLPLPDDAARVVTLDDLVRFFEHPARAFLQRRLQLYLGRDAPIIDDREPQELDTLERWSVGTQLLERAVAGANLDTAFAAVRASGALPLGVPGRCSFADLKPEVEAIGRTALELMRGAPLPPIEVDAEIGGMRVIGVLRDLWPAGQVRYQFSQLRRRHEVGMWIRHLILNWLRPDGCQPRSFIVGRRADDDDPLAAQFRPLDDAPARLEELLQLYRVGQTLPLPLFPRASRAYVETIMQKGAADGGAAALTAARKAFTSGRFTGVPAEAEDVYVQQLFGSRDPLDPTFRFFTDADVAYPSFADAALTVFEPLLAHREDWA